MMMMTTARMAAASQPPVQWEVRTQHAPSGGCCVTLMYPGTGNGDADELTQPSQFDRRTIDLHPSDTRTVAAVTVA